MPTCPSKRGKPNAHHITHWAEGGPTSVDNLVLLCGQHHRLIHHSHWTVKINEGKPEFGQKPARPLGVPMPVGPSQPVPDTQSWGAEVWHEWAAPFWPRETSVKAPAGAE